MSVIAGHFFALNTPFRQTVFDGTLSMFVQGMGCFFFGIGVPLFIMMTGYLNAKKVTFDRRYVRGMIKVLLAYVFFSIITFLFRKYVQHEPLGAVAFVKGILDFSMINYAWYIEMWIGLYLFTPFLNLGYNAIPDRRMKKALIVLLYLMVSVPYFTNRYGQHLMPGFWMSLYPVMFFVIGRYIKEYEPVMKWWKLVAVVIAMSMINPLFATFVMKERTMMIAGEPWGMFGTITAVCVFLLLYKTDIKQKIARWCITKIALLSLDIYLCCYMVDSLVYPYFMERYYESQPQFGKWFFVVVSVVVLISACIAQIKVIIFKVTKLDKI